MSLYFLRLLLLALSTISISLFAAQPSIPVSVLPVKDPNALISNELSHLDTLIQATQQSLNGQQALRTKIVEYQKVQDAYLKHPNDNELLFKMIKIAYTSLKIIEESHLEHTFDPEFIRELKVLAQVAAKHHIPKPSSQ